MAKWIHARLAEVPHLYRPILRKHWFYLLCQMTSIGCWLWWLPYRHLPLPGYAVAILAGLAALMSVHPDLGSRQKFVYLLLIGGFLMTEFRAIRKDHEENEAAQKRFFDQQKQGFESVAAQASSNFAATSQGLEAEIKGLNDVILKTQHVESLTAQSLENITGGRSFVVLQRMGGADSVIWAASSQGNSSVHQVSVQAADLAKFEAFSKHNPHPSFVEVEQQYQNASLGDFSRNMAKEITLSLPAPARVNFFFSALNGFWNESYTERVVNNKIEVAVRVYRNDGKRVVVMFERVTPGFPLDKNHRPIDESDKPLW